MVNLANVLVYNRMRECDTEVSLFDGHGFHIMRYPRIQIGLFIVLVLFFVSACIAAEEKSTAVSHPDISINNLIARAETQKSTKAGESYWWQVFEKLDSLSDDRIMPCVSGKSDPRKMYKYVLEILEDGAIKKVHWEVVDDFTECIDGILVKIRLQGPPESPFYFYLSEI